MDVMDKTRGTPHTDPEGGFPPEPSHQSARLNKVLLVEDNLLAQKATKFILEKFNCDIDVASNGEEAYTRATTGHYDLIFMDIGLPDKDGFEVTTSIRSWEHENQRSRTPIFALTAHADLDHKRHCKAVGMDEVLTKPLLHDHKEAILNRFNELKTNPLETPAPLANIDWQQAVKLAGGKEDNAKQLLDATVAELPEEKQRIVDAYDAGNTELLADLIHRLHGVLCYVGTPALKFAIFECETALSKGENIKPHYARLIEAIDNLLRAHEQGERHG